MKWLDPIWWKGLSRLLVLEYGKEAEKMHYLVLKKDQNRVKVLEKGTEAKQRIFEKHAKLPILLVGSGKWIMEGMLEKEDLDRPVEGLMGVRIEDTNEFAWEVLPATKDRAWLSLVRQEKLNALQSELGAVAGPLVGIRLSRADWLYGLSSWMNAFSEKSIELHSESETWFFKSGRIAEANEVQVGVFEAIEARDLETTAEIRAEFMPLYAAALAFWLSPTSPNMPLISKLESYTQAAKSRNILAAGALVLGIWALLLFSFRIQGERKQAELEQLYSQNLPVLDALSQLDEKINSRLQLREQLGTQTLAPTRSSFYLDRLALPCPLAIQLRQVIFAPEEEDLKRAGAPGVENWQLLVRGECEDSQPIANYSTALESRDWVTELKVVSSRLQFQSGLYEFIFLIRTQDVG